MADTVDSAVGYLLQNLKDLVLHNTDLIVGVRDNVAELIQDLERLKAFFKDYTEKHNDNEILGNFVSEIRSVIYEAEDAIETYILLISIQKKRSTFSKALHAVDHASELRRVGKQIEKVREYVQVLYKEVVPLSTPALKLDENPTSVQKRVKSIWVDENSLVGFEDAAQEVIELLTGESTQLEVISIIGMLGLGKTTLARKVFTDPRIEYLFFVRQFVNVSHDYSRREVFLGILKTFTRSTGEIKNMSEEELAQKIRENLQSIKYFIVLDDIWTREAWDDLKIAFPDNKKGSRLLITSQNKPVALHANVKIAPYHLRFLYPHESRELLRRLVFGENSCPAELEECEVRILQRCGGLPLAIVVLAGVLVNHRERKSWWQNVAQGVNDFIARDKAQMIDLIKMSYNNLPYQLKSCFLYMGIFPEDFEIPVWKLLRLWIAEGFIPHHHGISLEDMAGDYLMDLVDKNLVLVGRRRWDGRIKTCRIHDTLREFCQMEAMKVKFFKEIRFDRVNFVSTNTSDNYRRLCINDCVLDYIISRPSGERVRSFLSFSKEEITLHPEHVSFIPKAFKLLRVLEIKPIIFTRFPIDIFNLVLLKYIAISCHLKILPVKLSNLLNLQTLIIETSSRTIEIKADIWNMKQLRHLHTNASTCLPKSEHECTNLQTLSTISPESCKKEVFERTPNLEKLGIFGDLANLLDANGQSSFYESLLKLEKLENLKLLSDDISFKLQALPSPSMFPRKLRSLTLENTSLYWEYMSTLGKLEKLEMLKLKDNAFQGTLWQTEDGGFRSLRVLHIGSTDLMRWEASASHFPVLRSLFLRRCTKLEAIPQGLGDLSTLQEIDLYCTNSMVAASARKIHILKYQAMRNNSKSIGFKLFVYPPE